MHLLENSSPEFKEVAQKLKSFYVDNCVAGVFSVDEIEIFIEKTKLLCRKDVLIYVFLRAMWQVVDKHSGETFILGIIWDMETMF
ncbi:hypothetical protein TNCT_272751 [Trichonephila clavata]|uniref:Uncharacterized protein n=1 Tax=Trichonephila clavata TaxID=2740835 RepID=A0A8X6IV78_TRICU|nr:hypothetical protein TNCT_272751 [Trichonephila clavata]